MNEKNLQLIDNELQKQRFDLLDTIADPNDRWLLFKNMVVKVVDSIAPKVKLRVKGSDLPWLDGSTFRLKLYRDKLYKRALISKSETDWNAYQLARNDYSRLIKRKMHDYFFDKNTTYFKSSKKYWCFYKKYVKTKKNKTTNSMVCDEFLVNDVKISDAQQIASSFNAHFATYKQPNIPSKTDCALFGFEKMKKLRTKHLKQLDCCKFNFVTVNTVFVEKLLSSLDTSASPGISDVPVKVLKYSARCLAVPLTKLINSCIVDANLPSEWKFAIVNPLYKGKGDLTDLNSFRGISVLPPIAKLFEKIIHQQILIYFNLNNLLHKPQHGFRTGFSCETALHELVSAFKLSNQKKLINLALFVDFRKAFDYVNSDLLLLKLRFYGFGSESLKLIQNYFTSRKQMVRYRNADSSILEICLGVPQGSILGPLLFLIFINDMIFEFEEGKCALFADDTTIRCSGQTYVLCWQEMQLDVHNLQSWCRHNRLMVNWEKTFAMVIGDARYLKNIVIPDDCEFGSDRVKLVRHFKLLGVIIDETLSFKLHIDQVCKKVHAAMQSIKSKFFISFETRLQFFKTFVLPHFDYCLSLCIYYSTEQRMRLVALYNSCLRRIRAVVLKSKSEHIRDIDPTEFNAMLLVHKLFSLQYRIFYRISLFIFKIHQNRCPPLLFNSFNYLTHGYNLRGARRLCVTVTPRVCDDMNFMVFAPKFLNLLYLDTLDISFCDFKFLVLNHLTVLYNLFNRNFCFFNY